VEETNPLFAARDGVLFDKTENRLVCYPAGKKDARYTVPKGVSAIGNSAFYGCESLTAITLPDSLTTIEYSAFSGCESLTVITLPDGLTAIGDEAFKNCKNLKAVRLSRKTVAAENAFEDTPAEFFYTD
jgi:hypothetical protein